ncbi:ESCRT-0 subunit protein hse1, partial [Coemansia helicoidea]
MRVVACAVCWQRLTPKPCTGCRAQQCFEVINERVLHRNANVVLYTMTLVQSMVENCGQCVRQQVASRAFTTTLTRVLNDKAMHEKAKSRILGCIQQWAFDFRQDPTLSLMEETYTKLRAQRFAFPSPQKPKKIPTLSDLERQKEEDDLQLALALSLSSTGGPQGAQQPGLQTPAAIRSEITRKQTIAGGGPAAAAAAAAGGAPGSVTRRTTRAGGAAAAAAAAPGTSAGPADGAKRKVQVKALFDFAPTEAGELGFYKGDVIDVLDQKYRDWWRGELRGKSGIFPANFVQPLGDVRAEVSRDVDAEVEVFSEAHNIEALLRMLGSIDPLRDNVSDNEEVQRLYGSTMALRPKLVRLIEKYSRKKDELVQLDAKFANSIRLYDELMQSTAGQPANYSGGYQQPQQQQLPPQPQQLPQMHMQSPQMRPQQQFQTAPQQLQPAPQQLQPAPQQLQPAPQQLQPAPQQFQQAPQQFQQAPQPQQPQQPQQ